MSLIDPFRSAEPRYPKWDGTAWELEPIDMPKNDNGVLWLFGLFHQGGHPTITLASEKAVKEAEKRHGRDLDEALKELADKARRRKRK